MLGARSQSADGGNALFHTALRGRATQLENADSRVVEAKPDDARDRLPVLPHLRHLRKKRPADESALKVDFKFLLLRHGSYAKARQALRRAREQQSVLTGRAEEIVRPFFAGRALEKTTIYRRRKNHRVTKLRLAPRIARRPRSTARSASPRRPRRRCARWK